MCGRKSRQLAVHNTYRYTYSDSFEKIIVLDYHINMMRTFKDLYSLITMACLITHTYTQSYNYIRPIGAHAVVHQQLLRGYCKGREVRAVPMIQ